MSARDAFSVYLYGLDPAEVESRVLEDGRHVLDITRDVALYVRTRPTADGYVPADDLPAVIAGLRKLAATAEEMARTLDAFGDAR